MKYDDELILKAAWYYYIENMTQQAIASKLEISRMKKSCSRTLPEKPE